MDQITPAALGSWLIVLYGVLLFVGAIVAIAVGVRKLFERKKEEYVRHEDFEELRDMVMSYFNKVETSIMSFATKSELQEVKKAIEKTEDVVRERLHEIANVMGPLPAQVTLLIRQQERLESRLEAVFFPQAVLHPKPKSS